MTKRAYEKIARGLREAIDYSRGDICFVNGKGQLFKLNSRGKPQRLCKPPLSRASKAKRRKSPAFRNEWRSFFSFLLANREQSSLRYDPHAARVFLDPGKLAFGAESVRVDLNHGSRPAAALQIALFRLADLAPSIIGDGHPVWLIHDRKQSAIILTRNPWDCNLGPMSRDRKSVRAFRSFFHRFANSIFSSRQKLNAKA